MTRPRGAHALLAAALALMLATLAIAQPVAAMAQATGQTQSQTAGSATVTFGPDWRYDADISDATSAFLAHTSLTGTLYIHGEIADATVTDPALALEQFATGFFSEFGDQDHQLVDSGTLTSDPSTAWHLYTVTQSGTPYGMLVTGNTSKVPGTVVADVLLSPVTSFAEAVQSAKNEIDINGAGSPFADFDGAQLAATLQGGATTATTPATGTTPAAGTTPAGGLTLPPLGGTEAPATGTETPAVGTETPATGTTPAGGLTLPPLGGAETPATGTETPAAGATVAAGTTPAAGTTAGQASTVVVNGVTVAYGAPWTYQESISTPDEVAFFTHGTDQNKLFAYARTPSSSTDAQGSLTQFNTGFFGSFGATNVQQVSLETLPSGHAWSLNVGDKDGTPIALLALADVTTDPTEFRVQLILAPVSDFPVLLPDAQSAITVDGQPALGEIDVATVLSQLGVGETATTGTTGGTTPVGTETTTTTTTTTQGAAFSVVGDVSQYEAQDTQGTCDALGWAATSSDQIPATEQDVSYRSSCVGGGTFFAACGTAAPTDLGTPEAGMVWIQCDVTVRVDGAPMTLSMFDFELSDSTGAVYTFDIMAALASIMSVEVFPEEPVQTGQSATGSVLFSVPETAGANGPWLLSVEPETLATTGEQPGTIVVAGDLSPFAAPTQ